MDMSIIADWAMRTGLAVSLLVGLILVIRRPVARYFGPHFAYALWSIPVIRLAMPSITLPDYFGWAKTETIVETIASPATAFSIIPPEILTVGADPVTTTSSFSVLPLMLIIWAIGAIVWLTVQLGKQVNISRDWRANSVPVPAHLSALAYSIQRRLNLKKSVDIRIAADETGPLVSGVLSPLIILPHDFFTRFNTEQQRFVLMHEIAHVKRRDLSASVLCLLFRAVNWPNPLIHFAAQKFRADQEAACDATVLKAIHSEISGTGNITRGYAETLVTAVRSNYNPQAVVPLGLTMTHPLKERLMTMKNTTSKSGWLTRSAAAAVIIGLCALTAPVSFAGDPSGTTVEIHAKDKMKSVIKIVKDDDGVKTKKHYEIIKEDGETKAFSIDEAGNKTEVEMSEVKGLDGQGLTIDMKGGHMKMFTLGDDKEWLSEDGHKVIKRHIEIIGDGEGDMDGKKVRIMRMHDGDDIDIDIDELAGGVHGAQTFVFKSQGDVGTARLDAAERLIADAIKDADIDDASRELRKAKRELEKAQKALEAAKKALADK